MTFLPRNPHGESVRDGHGCRQPVARPGRDHACVSPGPDPVRSVAPRPALLEFGARVLHHHRYGSRGYERPVARCHQGDIDGVGGETRHAVPRLDAGPAGADPWPPAESVRELEGSRAEPVHRRSVGRVRRRHLQPRHQPVRRNGRHRSRRRHGRAGAASHRRGPARLRYDRLAAHSQRRTHRAPRSRRRPHRPRPRGARRRGDPEHRQGHAREPRGYGGRREGLPLLRQARRRGGRRPIGRHWEPGRHQPHRPRASGRVRPHRAVELPAAPAQLEDRAGPRRGQHRRHEARPDHTAQRDPPHAPPRGGRHAAGGRQPRAGSRRARRAGPRRLPRRGPDLAHRRHRSRAPAPQGRGRQHQAGRPGARWQEPEHRVRRRRFRDRGR